MVEAVDYLLLVRFHVLGYQEACHSERLNDMNQIYLLSQLLLAVLCPLLEFVDAPSLLLTLVLAPAARETLDEGVHCHQLDVLDVPKGQHGL